MAKADLLQEAADLGIEGLSDRDTVDAIKERIEAHREEVKAQEARLVDVSWLEANSETLFGVPRSVFVGAKSAGFISGNRISKEDAESGVRAFLNYQGGS